MCVCVCVCVCERDDNVPAEVGFRGRAEDLDRGTAVDLDIVSWSNAVRTGWIKEGDKDGASTLPSTSISLAYMGIYLCQSKRDSLMQ